MTDTEGIQLQILPILSGKQTQIFLASRSCTNVAFLPLIVLGQVTTQFSFSLLKKKENKLVGVDLLYMTILYFSRDFLNFLSLASVPLTL